MTDTTNHPTCGHDARRCCDDCCPESSESGNGGGCSACDSALALPRVGAGMDTDAAQELVRIIADEVNDSDFAHALRGVLADH